MGLLLRRGAEANARDKFWQTPLHVAAANRATRCAETLLTQLSNLNMADRTGRTALHHAAQSGFQEVRSRVFASPAQSFLKLQEEMSGVFLNFIFLTDGEVTAEQRGQPECHR